MNKTLTMQKTPEWLLGIYKLLIPVFRHTACPIAFLLMEGPESHYSHAAEASDWKPTDECQNGDRVNLSWKLIGIRRHNGTM